MFRAASARMKVPHAPLIPQLECDLTLVIQPATRVEKPQQFHPWETAVITWDSGNAMSLSHKIIQKQKETLPGEVASEEMEEDSNSPDTEGFLSHPSTSEDPWDTIRKTAVKEGDWQIVSKFVVTLVCYERRGENPRYEPMLYGEIKELCRATKDHGRDSPYWHKQVWDERTKDNLLRSLGVVIYHYMDNILLAAKDITASDTSLADTIESHPKGRIEHFRGKSTKNCPMEVFGIPDLDTNHTVTTSVAQ
ncbi:hypothetical protein TURU_036568 [Turdus rufiventris]|nr:hypothetical protein TURU_036568 [Turdus rufiventris]